MYPTARSAAAASPTVSGSEAPSPSTSPPKFGWQPKSATLCLIAALGIAAATLGLCVLGKTRTPKAADSGSDALSTAGSAASDATLKPACAHASASR